MKTALTIAVLGLLGAGALAQDTAPDLYTQARAAFVANDCKNAVRLMKAFKESAAFANSSPERKRDAEKAIAYCTGTTSSQSLSAEKRRMAGEAEIN